MKRRTSVREDDRIDLIPEYGRQKLLAYADSFRDLADLFEDSQARDEPSGDELSDRQEYLCRRRLQESQGLLAEHLKEMAHILAVTARETCRCRPMGERRYKQMAAMLRESGIMLKDFLELEHEDGHREISLVMRQTGGRHARFGETEYISTEDVADYISVAMNRRPIWRRSTMPTIFWKSRLIIC